VIAARWRGLKCFKRKSKTRATIAANPCAMRCGGRSQAKNLADIFVPRGTRVKEPPPLHLK
jgi:hypothetical protein